MCKLVILWGRNHCPETELTNERGCYWVSEVGHWRQRHTITSARSEHYPDILTEGHMDWGLTRCRQPGTSDKSMNMGRTWTRLTVSVCLKEMALGCRGLIAVLPFFRIGVLPPSGYLFAVLRSVRFSGQWLIVNLGTCGNTWQVSSWLPRPAIILG